MLHELLVFCDSTDHLGYLYMLLCPGFPNLLLSDWVIDARCEKLCFKSLLTLELCNTYAGSSQSCLLFPAFAHNILFLICQNRPTETNSEVDTSASPSVAQLAGKFKEQAASITGKEVRSSAATSR